ncbi:Rho guanine nucleotide exchange factor [Marasmius crinis-equi]|uniref:Rho guanine nucleotide exchange factor n=1 Tax=Marasmius crinis-equi TaxID=585013 RepID=A0ABR3FHV1_9AGAR
MSFTAAQFADVPVLVSTIRSKFFVDLGRDSFPNPAIENTLETLELFLRNEGFGQGRVDALLKLKGEKAQTQLNILQNIAEKPEHHHLQKLAWKIMFRLCKESGEFPQCCVIRTLSVDTSNEAVGGGKLGEVWKGQMVGVNNRTVRCAVKMPRTYLLRESRNVDSDEESEDEDGMTHELAASKVFKAYLREAIRWRQLQHPNILPFLGMYYLDDNRRRVCLISPYMKRGDLNKFLGRRNGYQRAEKYTFSSTTKATYEFEPRCTTSHLDSNTYTMKISFMEISAMCVMSSITFIISCRLVLALLQSNILVTDDYRAVLCDFGLSPLAVAFGLGPDPGETRGYISPERLMIVTPGWFSTKESDVYAFGSLCHMILTKYYKLSGGNEDLHPEKRPENLPHSTDLNYVWHLIQDCWSLDRTAQPKSQDIVKRIIAIIQVSPSAVKLQEILNPTPWPQSLVLADPTSAPPTSPGLLHR